MNRRQVIARRLYYVALAVALFLGLTQLGAAVGMPLVILEVAWNEAKPLSGNIAFAIEQWAAMIGMSPQQAMVLMVVNIGIAIGLFVAALMAFRKSRRPLKGLLLLLVGWSLVATVWSAFVDPWSVFDNLQSVVTYGLLWAAIVWHERQLNSEVAAV